MGKMMAGLTNAGVQNGDGQVSYPGSPAATAQTLAKDSAATLQPGSAQVDGSADNSDFGVKLNDPTTQGAQPKLAPGISFAQAQQHPAQMTTKGKVLSMLLEGLQGAAAGDAAARTGDPRHGYAGLGAAGLAGLNVPFQNQERANMLQQQEGQNQIQQAQLQSLPLQRQLQAATLQKEQAETINKGYIPTKTGGVLDLKTNKLVPGTEQADKNGTVENAIAARAKEVQDAGGDVNADPKIQQLIGLQKQAQKPPAGDVPLGAKVSQLNAGLTQLYQTRNPGKPLPAALTLPPDATSEDYKRISQLMENTENTQGKITDHQDSVALRKQMQQNSFDQQEHMNDVHQNNLTAATKTMVESAPGVIDLANKVKTLVGQQKNTLGPAASRWNEFMSGKVGEPNPEFTKLRTDVGLLQTKLMRMHVGSRGSKEMMEHFKGMIDSGKQSPENMNAALDEIISYANDVNSQKSGSSSSATPAAPAPAKSFFDNIPGAAKLGAK